MNLATVKIWDKRVGVAQWFDEGFSRFEFDPKFARTGWDLSPIMLPNRSRGTFSFVRLMNTSFKGLPGLLADSLPDRYGNELINAWLASQGRAVNSLNPLEVLCFIGKRGMGALEFEPAMQTGLQSRAAKIEISGLVDIAQKIMDGRYSFQADLGSEKQLLEILKIGSSAGGARAKALIAWNPKTDEVRSGQANVPAGFSHWLIKFDGVADSQLGSSTGYGRVEMAYHHMAKAAGIEMTQCGLLEESGRAHFMTERFDRAGNEKIHVQTYSAMAHIDFALVGAYSYEGVFSTMRSLSLHYNDTEQLFRRMVFNVLARNCDDHAKNFAFLMPKDGKWKLAPAYDICHAYRPGSSWVSQHSMTVNGKRTNISNEDFLAVAKTAGIRKSKEIISEVASAVERWESFARQVDVAQDLRQEIADTHLKF